MEQHINYITLGVADLAESRRFYRDVFGWRETADSNENIAFFQAGNALLLALFGQAALARDAQIPEQSSGFPRFTLAHNVGSEAEVDTLFAGFAAKNANIIKAPQKVFLIRFCRNCAETALSGSLYATAIFQPNHEPT